MASVDLYPKSYFVAVELPREAERALAAALDERVQLATAADGAGAPPLSGRIVRVRHEARPLAVAAGTHGRKAARNS